MVLLATLRLGAWITASCVGCIQKARAKESRMTAGSMVRSSVQIAFGNVGGDDRGYEVRILGLSMKHRMVARSFTHRSYCSISPACNKNDAFIPRSELEDLNSMCDAKTIEPLLLTQRKRD